MTENMRLLVKETPLGQHVKGKKNLDLLIKHRDTPLVRRAMRDVYTGTQLKKMLQMLAAGTTT